MNKKNLLKKLKDELSKKEVLVRLKNEKYFLLSNEEKRLLNVYLKDNRLIKYKLSFISLFIKRITLLDNEKYIFYIKNLNMICNLYISFKISKGNISNIDFSIPTNIVLKKDSLNGNFYFQQLIDNENYEELFNLYGLREIERDSDLLKK